MRIRFRPALSVLALLVALAVALPAGMAWPGSGLPPSQAEEKTFLPLVARRALANAVYTVRQRFGIGVVRSSSWPGLLSDFDNVEQLGFGWYTDWTYQTYPQQPPGIEFVQLVAVYSGSSPQGARGLSAWQPLSWPSNSAGLQAAIEANPGALWVIGNEPETRGQGELAPEEYADIYHDVYYFVKSIDPTARVAIAGVVMPSPLRLQWLDRCLDHYEQTYGGETMPIDVWNIHMQILQEHECSWGCGIPYGLFDPDDGVCTEGRPYGRDGNEPDVEHPYSDNCSVPIFQQLVTEFCTWLNEKGERGKPVIITEYGVLLPSEYFSWSGTLPERIADGDRKVVEFMQGTFDYMLHTTDPVLGWAADGGRLTQRWAWFSLNMPPCLEYDPKDPDYCLEFGYNGWLYDWEVADDLTEFGEAYRDYILSQATPTPTPP